MGSSHIVRRVAVAGLALIALTVVPSAPSGVPSDPKAPVDRSTAADNKRAASATTRFRDLVPGFSVDSSKERTPLIPHCDAYPGDRSDVTVTGSATSSFTRANDSIASTVLLFKTGLDSDRYWKATVKPKYVNCLARFVKGMMVESATTTTLMAKQIPIGPTTAEKVMAYRTISRVAAPGIKTYTWSETVAFVKLSRAVGIIRVVWVNYTCDCHTGLALDMTMRLRTAIR